MNRIELHQLAELIARGAGRSPELHAEFHRQIVHLFEESPEALLKNPTEHPVLFLEAMRY